jgi:hypothetical protein
MKATITHFILLCSVALLFSACGGKIESFSFQSPNGDRSIDIKGERESPAGPIIVTVTLNVPAGSKSFKFEQQSGSLTKETCTAKWLDNARCNLSFKLDDDTSWEVEAYLLDDKVQAIKKFNIDGKTIFE